MKTFNLADFPEENLIRQYDTNLRQLNAMLDKARLSGKTVIRGYTVPQLEQAIRKMTASRAALAKVQVQS